MPTELVDGSILEQVDQTDIITQVIPDTVGDGHQQEGVAADIEEPVVHADLFRVQHGFPDGQQLGFELRLRQHDGPVPRVNHLTRAQGLTIDLAAERQGKAFQLNEHRRHHIIGQSGPELFP